ncbi:tyrosine-type recombinase/integrase [Saccharopolyspora hattusasensis]|uniref:tyrosine-type recombinase/integrase n=1 Tax=Saccharopolyspora hattusasensis TaxID=1128679 RepID=UPI003D999B60
MTAYLGWCEQEQRPPALDRTGYGQFSEYLIELGRSGSTVHIRQQALKAFSRWIAAELDTDDQLAGLPLARKDRDPIDPYTEDELRALIATCKGRDFTSRRDEAAVRFMVESMGRASEVCAMTVEGTDVHHGVALIERGKGGKGRFVAFGPDTALALDRYLRLRRGHSRAHLPNLWLGYRGNGFGYDALYSMVKRRARQAGIPDAYPHRFRHTGATRWLEAGGSEGGLVALAGWSSRQMLDRYVAATASKRAVAEARRLQLPSL